MIKHKRTSAEKPYLSVSDIAYALFARIQALFELIYTSARIDKLLLAGEKGMAFGANFNTKVVLCGSCNDCFSAGTFNCDFLVFGMYSFLHFLHPLCVIHAKCIISQEFQLCKRFGELFFKNCKKNVKMPQKQRFQTARAVVIILHLLSDFPQHTKHTRTK